MTSITINRQSALNQNLNQDSPANQAKQASSSSPITEHLQKGNVTSKFVSSRFRAGEAVGTGLLSKLKQINSSNTQLAVPRSRDSRQVFATGVSDKQVQAMKSENAMLSERLQVANRILSAASVVTDGLTNMQKIDLANMLATQPGLAFTVLANAGPDRKEIGMLIALAKKGELMNSPNITQQVYNRRDLLSEPLDKGGLAINASQLTKGQRLGGGNFGQVNEFVDKSTGTRLAGKTLNSNKVELFAEEKMLAMLPHSQHLVQSYGIHHINGEDVLLMEFVDGKSMKSVLDDLQSKALSPADKLIVIKHLAHEIFLGLAELQKLGLVHDDVRGVNMLVQDSDLSVKIADFGLAKTRGSEPPEIVPIAWLPPESFNEKRASISVDTFSAARVLVGEFLHHLNLFNVDSLNVSPNNISMRDLKIPLLVALTSNTAKAQLLDKTKQLLNNIDPTGQLADFIEAISHPDSAFRLRPMDALGHPFFNNMPTSQDVKRVFSGQSSAQPSNNQSTQVAQGANDSADLVGKNFKGYGRPDHAKKDDVEQPQSDLPMPALTSGYTGPGKIARPVNNNIAPKNAYSITDDANGWSQVSSDAKNAYSITDDASGLSQASPIAKNAYSITDDVNGWSQVSSNASPLQQPDEFSESASPTASNNSSQESPQLSTEQTQDTGSIETTQSANTSGYSKPPNIPEPTDMAAKSKSNSPYQYPVL